VRDGVIREPVRIFAPGFGAGAVAGYAVLRVDPAIVAVQEAASAERADAFPGDGARSAGEAGGSSTSEDVQVAFT
jgi:hypothetical protein